MTGVTHQCMELGSATDAELLDDKIRIALRVGVEACDRAVSAELLYDSLYAPGGIVLGPGMSPDQLPALNSPLNEAIPTPDRTAFVRGVRHAMTANYGTRFTAYSGALHTMGELARQGELIIWTQGDPIEQLRKLAYVGLGDLRRQIIHERGDRVTAESLRATIRPLSRVDKLADDVLDDLAAGHQKHQVFALEDRIPNLGRLTTGLAARGLAITPIWVQQGAHGHEVPAGASEHALQKANNAVDSIEDALNVITERRDVQRPLVVISDYDGVIGNRELQLAIQDNSVRQELERWEVPAEMTRSQDPMTLVGQR